MAGTLQALLERAAEHPDTGIRVLDRHENAVWLPWSAIQRSATGIASGLQDRGVRPRDRVAMVFPTGSGFLDAFFGTLLAGAVPVPLYPPVRLGRLDEYSEGTARMLRQVQASLVLLDPRTRRVFGGVTSRYRSALGCLTLPELGQGSWRRVSVGRHELALVQHSSGTTRHPHPVALTHAAVLDQTRVLNRFWPDTADVRHTGVSWLPLYHDMGLIGCVFPALERPSTLTLIGPEVFIARPATWLRAISRYRATISPAPNFAFALTVARVTDSELDGVDLSSWRVAPNGAEPISANTIRAFRNRFSRWGLRPETITPVYGLSEASLAVTFSDPNEEFRSATYDRESLASRAEAVRAPDGVEIVSVGRPIPGVDLRLRDPSGAEVAERRVGRIWVRGPSLMEGYLDQPGATARVISGGWLDTGDLGFLDDGLLYVTGRAKDVVILRGRNYDPATLEMAVDRVPGVRGGRAVAVSRMPEGGDREELLLFVETRRGLSARDRRLIPDRCADAMLRASGVMPDRVEVLSPGALPRTSSGKLRRAETLRRHDAAALRAPGPAAAIRLAGELVRSNLTFVTGRRRVPDES